MDTIDNNNSWRIELISRNVFLHHIIKSCFSLEEHFISVRGTKNMRTFHFIRFWPGLALLRMNVNDIMK